jgi:Cd2+/Zn2+-exporting ATPase
VAAPLQLERFYLKHLDCATCAAKIETEVRRIEGVQEAIVDFATLTLHVKASDPKRVIEFVQRTEPQIEVLPLSEASAFKKEDSAARIFDLKKEAVFLGAALLCFAFYLAYPSEQAPGMYIRILLVLGAYFCAGWNVFKKALTTVRRRAFFDENVLMVVATVGALAIEAYAEAIAVMIFYKIGELAQESAVNHSRRSIKALLKAKPTRAMLMTEAGFKEVLPEQVRVGDSIFVKPGEKIPLDGDVVEGRSLLDSAALTGENVPVSVEPGKTVMAGQISQTGALTIRVTRPFVESSIAKVMDLVENATARKARTETFITTFARSYTPVVVFIAATIALVPPLAGTMDFRTWIYRALVLLVISCPCALVISIPLGYFGGIGRASREGILVKGSNFIDALAAVQTVVFDKTGTLTKGVFAVQEVIQQNGFTTDRLLELAAAAESGSNHPIAAAILKAGEERGKRIDPLSVSHHTDFSGQGVSARYDGHTIVVGNDLLLHQKAIPHQQCSFDSTVAHVVVDDRYAGYIILGDQIRPESHKAVEALRVQGIRHLAMLTGDNACAAQGVSNRLGLDGFYADLLPEDKVKLFETIGQEKGVDTHKIAFVGDGINDAPVIARADVGIAMGGIGSDAAVETADVVLMGDSPLKVSQAISISRHTRRVVRQNILLAFAIKTVFICFGAFGMASMWEAVFADMGTALLAVANATRILRMKIE